MGRGSSPRGKLLAFSSLAFTSTRGWQAQIDELDEVRITILQLLVLKGPLTEVALLTTALSERFEQLQLSELSRAAHKPLVYLFDLIPLGHIELVKNAPPGLYPYAITDTGRSWLNDALAGKPLV